MCLWCQLCYLCCPLWQSLQYNHMTFQHVQINFYLSKCFCLCVYFPAGSSDTLLTANLIYPYIVLNLVTCSKTKQNKKNKKHIFNIYFCWLHFSQQNSTFTKPSFQISTRCCFIPKPADAALNTDQGSAKPPLSTTSSLLADQQSFKDVHTFISMGTTLFLSWQYKDEAQSCLLQQCQQLFKAQQP